MTMTETLRECHAIVWRYRAELEPYWPTPTTEDALLFAFTELGEAIDAALRTKGKYARNRDKDLSVLDELADCAMMLLTALGPNFKSRIFEMVVLHEWASYVLSMASIIDYQFVHQHHISEMLQRIATHPGMNLPARLTTRLERIKAKRMPPPTIAINDAYEQRKVAHGSEVP